MARPILAPAPVVTEPAAVFRDVFENQGPFRHFPHDLTGLSVLPHQRLAPLARGLLESADHTTLARCRSEAPGREDAVHRRRLRFLRPQTPPPRRLPRASLLALEDTRGEHGGSLVDSVDRPDNPRAGTDPLAPNPVTGVSVSGPVRFPVGLRRSRRAEELPPWEA
jgi:hypothetical protein